MSTAALGRQFPLFHGTAANLKAGDMVLPPAKAGLGYDELANDSGDEREGTEYDQMHTASATERERTAWDFAKTAAWGGSRQAGGGAPSQRSRVLEVEHAPDQRLGLEHEDNPDREAWSHTMGGLPGNYAEHISHVGFRVKRVEDIQPPDLSAGDRHGRQGTLPHDWSQHRGPGVGGSVELINHPSTQQQEHERTTVAQADHIREREAHLSSEQFKAKPTGTQLRF